MSARRRRATRRKPPSLPPYRHEVRGLKQPAVFTIAPSAPFAETLARGLIARQGSDPLALSSATIYLPTRRAARTFGEAFARVLGGAALLPQVDFNGTGTRFAGGTHGTTAKETDWSALISASYEIDF